MGIIKLTIIDREGIAHELEAPTDMGMNMMEVCKSYELPVEGHVVEWLCALHVTCTLSLIINYMQLLTMRKTC